MMPEGGEVRWTQAAPLYDSLDDLVRAMKASGQFIVHEVFHPAPHLEAVHAIPCKGCTLAAALTKAEQVLEDSKLTALPPSFE